MQSENLFNRKALTESGVSYSLGIVIYVVFSLVYSVAAQLIWGAGYADNALYRYLVYLLPQLCFAAAAFVFFLRSKTSVLSVYRPCKARYFFLAVLMQFGLLFSLSELNTLFLDWLQSVGYQMPQSHLPPLDGWNLLPAIIVIALLPAIFEETLFRGILVARMRASGWGTVATVFISGALFSLYHGNPAQTIYQLICGVCFALLTLRAGSVLPSSVAHFCNNAAILALTSTGYEVAGGWTMPPSWRLGLLISASVLFVGTLIYLVFDGAHRQKGGVKDGKFFFAGAAVGIIVCAVLWIANLVTGFIGG